MTERVELVTAGVGTGNASPLRLGHLVFRHEERSELDLHRPTVLIAFIHTPIGIRVPDGGFRTRAPHIKPAARKQDKNQPGIFFQHQLSILAPNGDDAISCLQVKKLPHPGVRIGSDGQEPELGLKRKALSASGIPAPRGSDRGDRLGPAFRGILA